MMFTMMMVFDDNNDVQFHCNLRKLKLKHRDSEKEDDIEHEDSFDDQIDMNELSAMANHQQRDRKISIIDPK